MGQDKKPAKNDAKARTEAVDLKDDATNPRRGLRAPPQKEQVAEPKRNAPVVEIADFLQDLRQEADPPPTIEEIEFLKPLVDRELSFIKRVCRPTAKQMEKIVVEAKIAYAGMARMVNPRGRRVIRAGQISFCGPNQEVLSENPFTRVRNDAAGYLKPLVSEEQYQRYIDESKQRDEFERGAAIDVAIDLLDEKLMLTESQRADLFKKLMANWLAVDVQWMQNYIQNPNFMPELPTNLIDPVLSPEQKSRWRSANQMRVHMQVSIQDHQPDGFDESWLQ